MIEEGYRGEQINPTYSLDREDEEAYKTIDVYIWISQSTEIAQSMMEFIGCILLVLVDPLPDPSPIPRELHLDIHSPVLITEYFNHTLHLNLLAILVFLASVPHLLSLCVSSFDR